MWRGGFQPAPDVPDEPRPGLRDSLFNPPRTFQTNPTRSFEMVSPTEDDVFVRTPTFWSTKENGHGGDSVAVVVSTHQRISCRSPSWSDRQARRPREIAE